MRGAVPTTRGEGSFTMELCTSTMAPPLVAVAQTSMELGRSRHNLKSPSNLSIETSMFVGTALPHYVIMSIHILATRSHFFLYIFLPPRSPLEQPAGWAGPGHDAKFNDVLVYVHPTTQVKQSF